MVNSPARVVPRAQKFLHELWMHTPAGQQCCGGVPEVVEARFLRQPRALQEPLKRAAGQGPRAHWLAGVAGEHGVVIFPLATSAVEVGPAATKAFSRLSGAFSSADGIGTC
jgi:hypothetical protein